MNIITRPSFLCLQYQTETYLTDRCLVLTSVKKVLVWYIGLYHMETEKVAQSRPTVHLVDNRISYHKL